MVPDAPRLLAWIMEEKMETTIVYWGYIGIMEKKMEASVVYWGYRDNGKENGNYHNGLCRDYRVHFFAL